jgi:hypothetical protein
LSYGRYYQKPTYEEELRNSSHDTYPQSQSKPLGEVDLVPACLHRFSRRQGAEK